MIKTTGFFSRSTRLDKSIAALEAEWEEKRIAPIAIAVDFINTTDGSNFEERFAQLSPGLRELIEGVARDNVLAFDSIIEGRARRRGYPGGWIALRDWARRQPWHADAVERVKAIMARWPVPRVKTAEELAAEEADREELDELFRAAAREEREREKEK